MKKTPKFNPVPLYTARSDGGEQSSHGKNHLWMRPATPGMYESENQGYNCLSIRTRDFLIWTEGSLPLHKQHISLYVKRLGQRLCVDWSNYHNI